MSHNKIARVNAVRRRTKKRLLKRMKQTADEDDGFEFGSVGMRKRKALYAHERAPSHKLHKPDAALATKCAHRACVLNSIQQQAQIIIQEIQILQSTTPSKRIKPKIVVFIANKKTANEWATRLGMLGKVGFIDVSDPKNVDRVLENFKCGQISIVLTTDDPAMVSRLYEQRATICGVLGASPPMTSATFLGRCTLAAKAAHGAYGDYSLSATFCLQTSQWRIAAKLMLAALRKYDNVVVTANFEPFANGGQSGGGTGSGSATKDKKDNKKKTIADDKR